MTVPKNLWRRLRVRTSDMCRGTLACTSSSKKEIVFSQTAFVDEVLKEHQMEDSKVLHTPMAPNFYEDLNAKKHKNSSAIHSTEVSSSHCCSYRSELDLIYAQQLEYIRSMWIASSLPSTLSKACASLSKEDMSVRGDQTVPPILQDEVDAELLLTKRAGSLVRDICSLDRCIRKQIRTALCTAEAEYFAMSECCKITNWLRLFLSEIHQASSKQM